MSAHHDVPEPFAAGEPSTEEPPPGLLAARTGLVLTIVGVVALTLGMFGATSSEVQPSCPAGTAQLALFQFDEQGALLVEPTNAPSPVLLSDTTSNSSEWSSTTAVVALVIKAGDGSKDVTYSPGVLSGSLDTTGLDAVLFSVHFCKADRIPPPTKPPPTTATIPPPTKPPPTTEVEPTTTTEVEPTTTTEVESTTTTEVEPTTTTEVEPTTTTDGPPESSSPTTVASVPPSSSTTSVPGSSTPPTGPGPTESTVPGSTSPPAPQVSAAVIVATSITPDDDTRTGSAGALAFTGGSSLPLLLVGAVLVVVGVTMVMVARERTRSSGLEA